MKNRLAFTALLAASVVAFPQLSRADDARWESVRVYTLPGGAAVAVAVPSEWEALDTGRILGKQPLRFRDASGAVVVIPAADLTRASAEKRVLRPDLCERLAQNER